MRWIVTIPIAGSCTYEVEAPSRERAVEAAWAKADEGEEGDVEWEFHTKTDGHEIEVHLVREES